MTGARWIPYVAVGIGLYWLSDAWAATLLYQLGILLALVRGNRGEAPRLLRGFEAKWSGLAVGVGLSGGLALFLLWPVLGFAETLAGDLASVGLAGTGLGIWLIYFAGVNPVLEELLWRGSLARGGKGIESSDVFFAGYHLLVLTFFMSLGWALVATVCLVFASWFWRLSTRRTGGLLTAALSHAAGSASIAWAISQRLG